MARIKRAHTVLPSQDRRAVRHAAEPGRENVGHLDKPPRVAVVGGGIAGMSAAVALAERGMQVSLFEAGPQLGGRLAGWPVTLADGSQATMTRGFHAFFRQYYNLRGLLRRIDPTLDLLRPVPDYPLLHSGGARESFAAIPRQPPWSAAAFVARSNSFTVADAARMRVRAASVLFDVSVPSIYDELDGLDAERFLEDIGFPTAARHLAFEVFSRSFFAPPTELSAAELATMFHLYFLGSAEGLLFDVARRPFSEAIWAPLRHYLTERGAAVWTDTPVEWVSRGSSRRFRLRPAPHEGPDKTMKREFDAVVLAADVEGLRGLVGSSPALGEESWRARIETLRAAPRFLVSRVCLDTPVLPSRAPFLGTAGYELLDNVSVLDKFDEQARHWARRVGGSVVELHAYALGDSVDETRAADVLLDELRRTYPELAHARVLDRQNLTRSDCPLFAPGTYADRPDVSTSDPAVVVAGDLARNDLPVALMERAATTGFQAANQLLAHWGVRGHDLWSVPNEGRSRLLRMFARRAR